MAENNSSLRASANRTAVLSFSLLAIALDGLRLYAMSCDGYTPHIVTLHSGFGRLSSSVLYLVLSPSRSRKFTRLFDFRLLRRRQGVASLRFSVSPPNKNVFDGHPHHPLNVS